MRKLFLVGVLMSTLFGGVALLAQNADLTKNNLSGDTPSLSQEEQKK